jgi:dihydrofolate reductase
VVFRSDVAEPGTLGHPETPERERTMSRVVLLISVSLDGFIEGPNRDIDWHIVDDELHWHFNGVLRHAGAFLDGRVTYALMAGYWPTADATPDAPAPVAEFARIWRETPKIVYSRTLERADWNTTIAREVVPAEIAALKARTRGDLFLGGAELAGTFLRHGLIDEFRIYVHPVLIGAGTPLFAPAPARIPLRLAERATFTSGVVMLRYLLPGAHADDSPGP